MAEYSTQISQSPRISYTTADHLGSPRVITGRNGNVLSRRDFLPFGEDIFAGIGGRTSDSGQRYSSTADDIRQKFTGYQKDGETNLDFAEARMYENRYGRFTAVDPLIASGKSANPQTFNRYIYVGNCPTNLTDKYGLEWYRNGNRFEWSNDNKTLVNGDTIDENWKLVTDHVYYNDEVGWTVLDPKARDWTDHFETREEAVDFLDQPQDINLMDGVDEMMLVYDGVTIVGGVARHAGKAVLREGGELLAERFIKKTVVEVLRESAEKELVAAGKKVTTLAINKVVGRLAENLVEKHLIQEGYEILGRQVTAKLANGQIRYIDRLVKSPTGDIMAIEVKSGGAIYKETQMAKDMLIEKVGATLGNRAPDNLMNKFVQLKTILRRVE